MTTPRLQLAHRLSHVDRSQPLIGRQGMTRPRRATVALDRRRCLIAGEWLLLEPVDGGARTRLIARTRGGWLEPFARTVPVLWPLLGPVAALIEAGPGELLHHDMETRMTKDIEARSVVSPRTRR